MAVISVTTVYVASKRSPSVCLVFEVGQPCAICTAAFSGEVI